MIAAKFGDPVVGIDVHMVMVPSPAGPVPTPLPHPFVGVVFDPLGAAMGAAMGAVFGGGGAVVVNLMPTGNTGTEIESIPHIPTPPGVSPAPNDAPPGNEGQLVSGSKTVDFAGSSQSRTLSLVMSCGFPLNLPSSICEAVPMGAPVVIGGPEAVDWAAAATQAIRTKWASEKLHKLTKATKGSKRSKVICFLTGHPVDVMTGELLAEETDAELPGTIPLVFERNYRSRETEAQSLGPGWYHFFDAYVEERGGATAVRLPDGRPAEHPALRVGESYFHPPDRYTVVRDVDGYRLLYPEGLTYTFKRTEPVRQGTSARHRLVEIRDRARNVIVLDWRGNYLASITDTAGRIIAFRYSREGQLDRLLLLEGTEEILLVNYDYANGFLARATNPLGHAMRYAYRGGVLVEEVHRDGLTFHFEWDWDHTEGWCVRTWGDAGSGDPAVMDLAPGGTPPRAIYDRRIIYDKHRHRTMVQDLRGGTTLYEGNKLELVDKIIDATGLVTRNEWNEHAWKTAEENGKGERFEWTYDARGNRLVEKDPLGYETRWTYDALDRVIEVRDAKGGVQAIEYDRSDQPRAVRRPDGAATLYSHDDHGRLIGLDDPMGRRYRLQWSERHDLAAVTDGENRTTTYESDLFGRIVGAKDPIGRRMRVERDAAGNVTYLERFDGESLTMKYDREGRVIDQTDGQGRRVRLRYAGMGRLVEHTDAMGHHVRLRYDCEEDLIAVENQAGDLYRFEVDRAGKVIKETSFAGHRRQYVYDKAGRCERIASGYPRVTTFKRDAVGRVLEIVTMGGEKRVLTQPETETFAYDELGQLLSAHTPGADTILERDVLGRITREQQVVRASGADVAVSSRYDLSGLRVARSTTLAHEATYEHNQAGDLIGLTADWSFGAGRSLFQRKGLPQAVMGPFEIKFARDGIGQEIARRLPGGVSAVWSRDRFGRPVEQRVVTGARPDQAGTDVMRKGYAWQSADQIASISDLNPQTGVPRAGSAYEYDPRGHLIRQIFSNGEVLERQSDAVGNLFRSADKTDRVYGKGGVLLKACGTEYTFDADGYLSEKTLSDGAKWIYAWTANGYLKEVIRPDKRKVAFAYDAFGRRVRKEYDGKVTEYVWDGDDLVHERVRQADGKEQPLVTWLFEPGTFSPVAKIEGRKRFGIVSDHLGVPGALMTEAGQIAWRAQLDVYGVPREEAGVAAESDRTANPWRFPGQYEDAETGLYYNRFRYYDPEIGRYICEDPVGLLAGFDQFGYVQSPTSLADPLGLSEIVVLGENQDAVNQATRDLRSAGHNAQSMQVPQSQWRGGPAPFDTPERLNRAIQFNRDWINKKMDAGAKIVTIGTDGRNSVFYKAEMEEIAKRNYPVIKLKKLPSGETVDALRERVKGGGAC